MPRVSVSNWLRRPIKPAAGHAEFDAHPPVPVIVHVEDFALARAQLFHDHADELFRHVDGQLLDRLHELAVDRAW